ncbi:Protein of unknown function (DUF1641) [Caldisphaera lagunensis DSM 15908]|uniref:DUF1641 domain-containing protein n=1 Tax=Caldisphaera lagunensis (strain DSM 15908 / JCM 11604 / ANMR 0165 / IC-154) TaxID=1056495 RepID=L0ABG2_CALLD|nr:DUF1641 domain-containing protein [Caldisphaera lagunensis]AFZ71196.1 Protein of unknown function (DUF1641) [Caldisphaera lagunensis DSM 15908]
MEEINEAELQTESIERLLHLVELLNNILKDEELLKAISKLLVSEETFLVVDRLPQLIKLIEKLTRQENLEKIESLLGLIESLDKETLNKLGNALSAIKNKEVKPMSLSGLITSLSQPEVSKGLNLMLNLLKALGS